MNNLTEQDLQAVASLDELKKIVKENEKTEFVINTMPQNPQPNWEKATVDSFQEHGVLFKIEGQEGVFALTNVSISKRVRLSE